MRVWKTIASAVTKMPNVIQQTISAQGKTKRTSSLFPGWPIVLKSRASVNTDETSKPTVWNVGFLATLYVRKKKLNGCFENYI